MRYENNFYRLEVKSRAAEKENGARNSRENTPDARPRPPPAHRRPKSKPDGRVNKQFEAFECFTVGRRFHPKNRCPPSSDNICDRWPNTSNRHVSIRNLNIRKTNSKYFGSRLPLSPPLPPTPEKEKRFSKFAYTRLRVKKGKNFFISTLFVLKLRFRGGERGFWGFSCFGFFWMEGGARYESGKAL